MPFGLRNSPASFVKALRRVLYPVREHTDSYVDDMYTTSSSFDEHLIHLRAFLTVIRDAGLTLSINKCRFAQTETRFVGFIVGNGQFRPDPEKTKAVANLKIPESQSELRSVLGILGFYRNHVPRFAEIAKPLTDLTSVKSRSNFPLGDQEIAAFKKLKEIVCSSPVLKSPRFGESFCLYTDASQHAVGCCLAQEDEQNETHPIAYGSQKLTSTQSNWSTIEKEAYAVVWSLNKYHDIIFGAHVTVFTDHNPLLYLLQNTTHSAKLTRWSLSIQQYDVSFEHIKGKKNVLADGLSRVVSTN